MAAYCEKYDPNNPGMCEVFNRIYNTIETVEGTGIASNVVAACGENMARYLGYGAKIAKTKKSRLVLVELDEARYHRISGELKKLKSTSSPRNYSTDKVYANVVDRAQIMLGNILTYESLPGIKIPRQARVEDLGLGCRFDKLIYKAIGRLDTQRELGGYNSKSGKRLLKAQILDGSRKRVGDQRCLRLLQQYVSILGAKLGGINGVLPSSREEDDLNDSYIFRNGRFIGDYFDKKSGHKCTVYKHYVDFVDPGRIVTMDLYTYTNGGSMLSCVLVYR